MITAILFIVFNVLGWLLALTRQPFWAVLVYANIYFNAPNSTYNWWANYLPDLRWSLLAFFMIAVSMVIHRKKLSTHKLLSIKWMYVFCILTWIIGMTTAVDTVAADWHVYMLFTFCITVFALIKTLAKLEQFRHFTLFIIILCSSQSIKAVTEGKRVHGRLENIGPADAFGANEFGLLVASVIPLLIPFLLSGTRNEKIVCLLSLPLLVNALILTNSRSALVALIIGSVIAFVFYANAQLKKYMLIAAIFVIPAFLYLADETFIDRMATMFLLTDNSSNVALDDVSSGRLSVWLHGLDMVSDHPTGVGPGGFRYLARFYMPAEDLIFHPGAPYGVKAAHNSYLLVLVEQGFIGFFVFIGLCFYSLLLLYRGIKYNAEINERSSFLSLMTFSTSISLLVILVGGFFNSRVYYEFFWWLIAMSVLTFSYSRERKEKIESTTA